MIQEIAMQPKDEYVSILQRIQMDQLQEDVATLINWKPSSSFLQLENHFSQININQLEINSIPQDDIIQILRQCSKYIVRIITDWKDINQDIKLPIIDRKLSLFLLILYLHLTMELRVNNISINPKNQIKRWLPYIMYAIAYLLYDESNQCNLLPKSYEYIEKIMELCQEIQIYQANTITLMQPRVYLFANTLESIVALFSQDCTKEEWVEKKKYPKVVFTWIIQQVPFPYLGGDVIGRVFALIFPLIESLKDTTQYIGIQALSHMIQNITSAEVTWYRDILLNILKLGMSSRAPLTLDLLLQTLGTTLEKVSPNGDYTYYEQFVPRLLQDTNLCTEVKVQMIYLKNMRPIIKRLGAPTSLYIIRYLQPLIKVLISSLASVNLPLVIETLETLKTTVLAAWPRIPVHTEEIATGVFRAVTYCEIYGNSLWKVDAEELQSQMEYIMKLCDEILHLLADLNQSNTKISQILAKVRMELPQLAPFVDRLNLIEQIQGHNEAQ